LWVGKRKVYTKHGEFYGAPRGGGSTGSLTEHGGFTEHPGEVEAGRRVGSTGVSRSTQGRWKHGVFTEHGERSGKHGGEVEARRKVGSTGVSRSTEKGVENTEFLTEEYWKMHSFILYFYASMRRGRLMIIFFSC
jgi:hypothetical protein